MFSIIPVVITHFSLIYNMMMNIFINSSLFYQNDSGNFINKKNFSSKTDIFIATFIKIAGF